MSSNQMKELEAYPKYKHLYLLAFGKMLEQMTDSKKITDWTSPESVMRWWFKTMHGKESKTVTQGIPALFVQAIVSEKACHCPVHQLSSFQFIPVELPDQRTGASIPSPFEEKAFQP